MADSCEQPSKFYAKRLLQRIAEERAYTVGSVKRIDVVKKGNQWVGETGKSKQVVSKGRTKETAIRNTAKVAKKDPQPVSVKIHKVDGKFQEERTYPRSADPRRSKG